MVDCFNSSIFVETIKKRVMTICDIKLKDIKYNSNWQNQLSQDEWESFLTVSKLDDKCNKMWEDYRNQLITYDELSRYEFNLYISVLRNSKLEMLNV